MPKKSKGIKLTTKEAQAILSIKGGADVGGYELAGILRGIQRRGLPVCDMKDKPKAKPVKDCLFTITTVMMHDGNPLKKEPYFGAVANAKGLELAAATLA